MLIWELYTFKEPLKTFCEESLEGDNSQVNNPITPNYTQFFYKIFFLNALHYILIIFDERIAFFIVLLKKKSSVSLFVSSWTL